MAHVPESHPTARASGGSVNFTATATALLLYKDARRLHLVSTSDTPAPPTCPDEEGWTWESSDSDGCEAEHDDRPRVRKTTEVTEPRGPPSLNTAAAAQDGIGAVPRRQDMQDRQGSASTQPPLRPFASTTPSSTSFDSSHSHSLPSSQSSPALSSISSSHTSSHLGHAFSQSHSHHVHAYSSLVDTLAVHPTRRRNPAHPAPDLIPTGPGAGQYTSAPMSSPRVPGAARGAGSGGATTPTPPDHDSYTSALSPTVASFDEGGPGAAFSAFHRRRTSTSNPTRRRSSLIKDPMVANEPRSPMPRRSSNGHPPPSPSAGAGPSNAPWLIPRRTLSTQQEHKRSKSDEEPETLTVTPPARSAALPDAKHRRLPHRAIRITTETLPSSDEPPEPFIPLPRTHGVSIPPVLSPVPVSAATSATSSMPSELLRLPQDPNHILPLSTPPPAFRESLDYVGHASSGHSSTPRTSMSTSEEMSWGTGNRSFSDSSACDDDDSPTATSGWFWRSQGRPPSSRPIFRRAPMRLPMGTRRWGWLFAPIKYLSRPRDLTSLVKENNGSGGGGIISRKRGYDREKIYPTTTRRRPRVALGSGYIAQVVDFAQNEPWGVVLFLFLFAIFAICLGCSIKYILDPDKAALPWRDYALPDHPTIYSIQGADWPDAALTGYLPPLSVLKPVPADHKLWPYPGFEYPPHQENLQGGPRVDNLEPTTVFLAIFTYDVSADRRNQIRQSYASHPRSRSPGSEGVRLRFIMGRPRPHLKHHVDAEIKEFNDIVMLDTGENMNQGKTHTFFTWAADNAMVPDYEYPSHPRSEASAEEFAAQRAAGQEPMPIYRGEKRPDYIAKADDDAFIMLGEFERHLRVMRRTKSFWGYLVRERFMAGECYALSRDLAEYIRDAEVIRPHVHGKEDKLVSQWLRTHPEKEEILWYSEHTWIYDHPKAGTVYSHGFLFPDEVARVRAERAHGLSPEASAQRRQYQADVAAYSTVSQFGMRYRPPVHGLSPAEKIEALVEGSAMSRLRLDEGAGHSRTDVAARVDALMAGRPTFAQRFLGDPAERGGTVLVHYIKKAKWFDETRRALLGEE